MGQIPILVNYGGRWMENPRKYVCSHATGICISEDVTYMELLACLFKALNLDWTLNTLVLEFDPKEADSPLLSIKSDDDVKFYLLFKKDSPNGRYPLCVSIESGLMDAMIPKSREDSNNMHHVSGSVEEKENAAVTNDVPSHAPASIAEDNVFRYELLQENNVEMHEDPLLEGFEDTYDAHQIPQHQIPQEARNREGTNVEDVAHCGSHQVESSGTGSLLTVVSSLDDDEVKVNMIFREKKELQDHLSLIAIRNKFQFKVKKSNKKLLVVTCLEDQCTWRLRAMKLKDSKVFKVTKFVNKHSCSLNIITGDHRQATSRVIGSLCKDGIESRPQRFRPLDIVDEMRRHYGINISYEKGWRARESGLNSLRGSPEAQYALLPSYCHKLEEQNPGSVTEVVTDHCKNFKLLFVALQASLRGWMHCTPVIAMDGTHLKSKYKGTMFVAACKDGNNHILPLAVGVGDSENDIAWEWFLSKFRLFFF